MKDFKLRPFKEEDARLPAQAADNPKIAGNLRNLFPSPYTLEDAVLYINDCISNKGNGRIDRAIEVDGQTAGSITITVQEDMYGKSAELGYWLSEEHWRKGIMSEAVRQICREAFAVFDIVRIYAEPFAYNTGSRRVLEKISWPIIEATKNFQMHYSKNHFSMHQIELLYSLCSHSLYPFHQIPTINSQTYL